MPSILKSLLPWILFFTLFGHSEGSKEMAAAIALLSHVFFNYQALRKRFVLDIGALVFFLLFLLNVFIFKYTIITDNGYLISNCALALIAWISLIIRKPFTLQYARLQVALEVTASLLFRVVNDIITAIWATLFTLMALPNILELYDPVNYATEINMGVSILLLLMGIWVTTKFPNWFADKMIARRFNINIKELYAKERAPAVDFTEFNAEKVSKTYDISFDVIIVGAGPVGLASALLLQQHGIDVVIIEKHPGTSIHPKARGISCRSMELFRKLGIEKDVIKYNLPDKQNWFGWFDSLSGKLYARVSKRTDDSSISPTNEASAAQQYIEIVMLEKYREQGGKILFEHEVVNLSQNSQFVQVITTHRKTSKKSIFQGQYLIAADGAHSTVRELLKIPMIGPDEINVTFSVYCEIDLNEVLKEDKRFSIAFVMKNDRPAPMVLTIDGKNKWIFMFPSAGASAKDLKSIYTDEYIKSQIYDVIGRHDIPIKIISKQAWSLGSQVANQFSAGRTFLAGDAIHRFSPTGGMGMNTGLQDVDNLIWKLTYVIQKKAKPTLLNTYSQERLPSILDNMQWSLDNLNRIVRIQRTYEDDGIDNIDFQSHVKEQDAHLNRSGLDLGVIYESNIILKTNEEKPAIPKDQYFSNTYPGARLPHIELMRGNKLISSLDLVSTEFILLCYSQANRYIDSLDFRCIPTKIICIGAKESIREVLNGELQKLLDLNEYAGVWVRPDGHIAWKGSLENKVDVKKLQRIIDCL